MFAAHVWVQPPQRLSPQARLRRETLRAIRAVSRGEAIFHPAIAQRLTQYVARHQPLSRVQATASAHDLLGAAFPEQSGHERASLALIAQGYTNTASAECLVLSPRAVPNHVANSFGQLPVTDRAEAILRARNTGLGRDTTEAALRWGWPHSRRRGGVNRVNGPPSKDDVHAIAVVPPLMDF